MKFSETTVLLLLIAASVPVPGAGQPRMRTISNDRDRTTEANSDLVSKIEDDEDLPSFWSSEIISNLDSMLTPTPTTPITTSSPTPAPQQTSLVPSLDPDTTLPYPTVDPRTEPPTSSPDSAVTTDPTTTTPATTMTPTSSLKIKDIDNYDVLFTEINNIASYTTYCRTGEYTSVQIVRAIDETVHCITNFEGAGIQFGYEQDFPNRPIIRLDIEPPAACNDFFGLDDDVLLEEDDTPYKNYCGFFGKATFRSVANPTVTTLSETSAGIVDSNITAIASYTTFCTEDDNEYSNVEIVDFGGNIFCVRVSPGTPTIELVDEYSGGVIASVDVEPSLTCDGTAGGRSYACDFDGFAEIEWPYFNGTVNELV
eukprot:CAMPEP_0168191930 /NCGR_PEP_ID=MMETSP0139_2-20121125/17779_1 /TAXON_ID=44445 /ORGANISM="Pseudo-nitzschia australis, Strain 10249 10 AB" /LENGTH=368 /DNA_ID=CAMNT_0008115139 /DNA_START=120 /DNA_END=1226 /DNA_ORIENTATION=-